jgi:hypothetical protein
VAARVAWAERLARSARRLEEDVHAARASLAAAGEAADLARAARARAAAAARALDEVRDRWLAERRRRRERMAEAEADDRPGAGAD